MQRRIGDNAEEIPEGTTGGWPGLGGMRLVMTTTFPVFSSRRSI
jgi:hypothetical protein